MLKKSIKSLPKSPGVYQFFDKDDKLLYVGKAKILSNRVKSYFRFTPSLSPASKLSLRIKKMIEQACRLEYITVPNEHDAFILENSLIKQLKPKYNILLRDDKTYPYVVVDFDEKFPRLEITRKIKKGGNNKYFGPYTSGARDLLDGIYQSYPLVQKKSCAKGKKSCLFHQINRCLAPCEGKISQAEYKQILHEALKLVHNPNPLIKALENKMQRYSDDLKFEEAAKLRDMLMGIEKSKPKNTIDLAKLENFDLLAVFETPKTACNVSFFVRDGKIVSSSNSLIYSINGFDMQELYRQRILSFYKSGVPMPINTIYLAHEIDDRSELEELLSKRFGKKISIKNPKRGEKLSLVKLALANAEEIICKQNLDKYFKIKSQIQSFFDLSSYPNSIEVFDNSHLSSTARVGAIISWVGDGFEKANYRHYHLQSKDEYSQMREILIARTKRFEVQSPPDLWLIDGGKVLLDLACEIIQSSGANVDVLAISKEKIDFKANRAKGRAKDKVHDKNRSYDLPLRDEKLQFLQRLRDEAHRFAISFHRKTKIKLDKDKSFLKQKGLSEGSIKKLLSYFGSFEDIKKASFDEIMSIINKKEAKKLK